MIIHMVIYVGGMDETMSTDYMRLSAVASITGSTHTAVVQPLSWRYQKSG